MESSFQGVTVCHELWGNKINRQGQAGLIYLGLKLFGFPFGSMWHNLQLVFGISSVKCIHKGQVCPRDDNGVSLPFSAIQMAQRGNSG
jgi:hypothetical protein